MKKQKGGDDGKEKDQKNQKQKLKNEAKVI